MRTIKLSFLSLLALVFFAQVSSAATVSGKVVYEGEVPKLKPIKMEADPVCLSKHGAEGVLPQTIVLGEGNTMGNVFVYVKSGVPSKQFTPPTEPVVINQEGCMYHPHVVGVMVNQPLKFLNPDGTLHNVHALSKKNPEFNLAMPKFRTETTHVFNNAEFMFPIKCDVHPWMGAWIAVMPHPYFSVTGTDGKFEIKDLPPGTYEVEAWHEKLGTQTSSVTIAAEGDTPAVDFKFSRPQTASAQP